MSGQRPSRLYGRHMNIEHKASPTKRSKVSSRGARTIVSGSRNRNRLNELRGFLTALQSGHSSSSPMNNPETASQSEWEDIPDHVPGGNDDTDMVLDADPESGNPSPENIILQPETTTKKPRRITPSAEAERTYARWLELIPNLIRPLLELKAVYLSSNKPGPFSPNCVSITCSRAQRTLTILTWNGA